VIKGGVVAAKETAGSNEVVGSAVGRRSATAERNDGGGVVAAVRSDNSFDAAGADRSGYRQRFR
jgi:hypothetical protein